MAWVYLLLASALEVGFTTTLRFGGGFRHAGWTAACIVCVLASIYFLDLASRAIPLGVGYVVWTGIGAVGTVLVGILWFGEAASTMRGLLMLGIVACAVGLKLTGDHQQ